MTGKETRLARSARLAQLSNAASTGGAGHLFEIEVQASFVALMATGGFAPVLPTWPITRVALQARREGFVTDDCVVTVEQPETGERTRLLCQIKRQVSIRDDGGEFAKTLTAAWADFCNPVKFRRGIDALALITGPLSASGGYALHWLTAYARDFPESEFFERVTAEKAGPRKRVQILNVIRSCLTRANGGIDVGGDELHAFLCDFHILGYDFWNDQGVTVSLLHSHLSPDGRALPEGLWSQIVHLVASKNTRGAFIDVNNLPALLSGLREHRRVATQRPLSRMAFDKVVVDVATSHTLGLVALIGQFNGRNSTDLERVAHVFGCTEAEVILRFQAIEKGQPGLIRFDDGAWLVRERKAAWESGAASLTEAELGRFIDVATLVLAEDDPALALEPEERIMASFRNLVFTHSPILRRGLAEGLALAGVFASDLVHCSEETKVRVPRLVRSLLIDASWQRWASLDGLLPFLAEAAPAQFVEGVEAGLKAGDVFPALFGQERSSMTGRSYMTGVLWGLEVIGWSERHFVDVVLSLGQLAAIDLGGTWANRPGNSIVTMLLPWLPQTEASPVHRRTALRALAREEPAVGFRIACQLLPGRTTTSSHTHKPHFRVVAEQSDANIDAHYQEAVTDTASLVVELARDCDDRLLRLVEMLGSMPKPAFVETVTLLSGRGPRLPESLRIDLWQSVRRLVRHHRQFPQADWALPDEALVMAEDLLPALEPTEPTTLLKLLFARDEEDVGDEGDRLAGSVDIRRKEAVEGLLAGGGLAAVVAFAADAALPAAVGYALTRATDIAGDADVLAAALMSDNENVQLMVRAFISARAHDQGAAWLGGVDLSAFDREGRIRFLTALPFTPDAWSLAAGQGSEVEDGYWIRVNPVAWRLVEADRAIAQLLRVNRAWDAVVLASRMLRMDGYPSSASMLDAILATQHHIPDESSFDGHAVNELIKALQKDPGVDTNRLIHAEWLYVGVLHGQNGTTPVTLHKKLSSDPAFAMQVIRIAYRSSEPDKDGPDAPEALIGNAANLLRTWRGVPGALDGQVDAEALLAWMAAVTEMANDSGHMRPVELVVGKLLAHSPPDPDGFWLHRAVATILERRGFDAMREVMCNELFNSRGAHWVDPTGSDDLSLAVKYNARADDAMREGFPRLSSSVRDLADTYGDSARRRALRHANDTDPFPPME